MVIMILVLILFYWRFGFIFNLKHERIFCFALIFPFIDDGVVASESKKYIWSPSGIILFFEFFKS